MLMVLIIVLASAGQPEILMTGRPAFDLHPGPSRPPGCSLVNCRPQLSVGFGGAAGIPPKAAQTPIAITYSAWAHNSRMMSRFGRPSNVSYIPVPCGPLMILPSTQRIVSSSSPARMRSMISAASFGLVSESDGCQSSFTCSPVRKSDRLSPVLPGPSAPRIAIDSPLQEPHSIHNKVASLSGPEKARSCFDDNCLSCPEETDINFPRKAAWRLLHCAIEDNHRVSRRRLHLYMRYLR